MVIDNQMGVAVVALAIFAHAWASKIQGKPRIVSAIGWVINVLTLVVLIGCWVQLK
jgi:hypothetical protein